MRLKHYQVEVCMVMYTRKLRVHEDKKNLLDYNCGKIKMSSKESFNQISPSEFFYRNRDLAGFSNPTRSLYTAVREFVENSLDACDHSGVLADVHMSIKAVDKDKPDPKQYILTVKDNGPGIESKHVPLAFGTVLYGCLLYTSPSPRDS